MDGPTGDDPPKSKSKRKSKAPPPQATDEPIDDTFDAMLDNASKSVNLTASLKPKAVQRADVDPSGGWSNEMDQPGDENGNFPLAAPGIRRTNRRAAEEIVAADIPTILMDDVDDGEPTDAAPQIAVAPEFSIHQIASFKEMESEFSRERASQYIDPKIDIGILYQNLHLQDEIGTDDQKPWDWDKLFVEVQNAITNPMVD